MLGTTQTAVVQVVPGALLEMTRGVLRTAFSALVQKPVYSFVFDRGDEADEALLAKLKRARASRAVIVASPTSIKSFVLKFMEIVHLLEEAKPETAAAGGGKGVVGGGGGGFLGFIGLGKKGSAGEQEMLTARDLDNYKMQAAVFPQIMEVFQTGVLLLDEVDLILHPLRSELNWPLGVKKALDFTYPTPCAASSLASPGMRWQIALHVLDAIFFVSTGKTSNDLSDSAAAEKTLGDLRCAIVQGVEQQVVQVTPHLVVLQPSYYHEVSLHTRTHMHIHVCTHAYTCIHTCIYVYAHMF